MDNKVIISLTSVSKSYKSKKREVKVLDQISYNFSNNTFYAIMGHSGSGKSTLINILGLIDVFEGSYKIYGEDVTNFNDEKLSKLRMKSIGFIFQAFNLNANLKAFENVMVPMLLNKEIDKKERKNKAYELLKSVGLDKRINHFPNELSGGEIQRVAIARALVNNPQIILADEPTGNLDEKAATDIFNRLKKLSQNGKCVIVVSHNNKVKKYADKTLKIIDGKMVEEINEN